MHSTLKRMHLLESELSWKHCNKKGNSNDNTGIPWRNTRLNQVMIHSCIWPNGYGSFESVLPLAGHAESIIRINSTRKARDANFVFPAIPMFAICRCMRVSGEYLICASYEAHSVRSVIIWTRCQHCTLSPQEVSCIAQRHALLALLMWTHICDAKPPSLPRDLYHRTWFTSSARRIA